MACIVSVLNSALNMLFCIRRYYSFPCQNFPYDISILLLYPVLNALSAVVDILQQRNWQQCLQWVLPNSLDLSLTLENAMGNKVLILVFFSSVNVKDELSPSKEISFICFNERPLEMMKNAFYFLLKSLFVLKIFLPWFYGHV